MLPILAVIVGVAASAFTTKVPDTKLSAEYWVYTSSTNSNFFDGSKYQKITLNDPSDEGCDNVKERPCVLMEVTSSVDTQSELQNYLQNNFANDQQIAISAIEARSFSSPH